MEGDGPMLVSFFFNNNCLVGFLSNVLGPHRLSILIILKIGCLVGYQIIS